MKSLKEHAREIREAGKSEPDPEAVARTKRVAATVGAIIFVVGVFGLILASC